MEYVYILSNPKYPDSLKIGRTKNHPEVRANQLSRSTGTMGKYTVEWFAEVEDSAITEKLLHHTFRHFHVEKEFFKLDIAFAKKIAESAIQKMNELDYKVFTELNEKKDELEKRANLLKKGIKYLDEEKKPNAEKIIAKIEKEKQALQSQIKAMQIACEYLDGENLTSAKQQLSELEKKLENLKD